MGSGGRGISDLAVCSRIRTHRNWPEFGRQRFLLVHPDRLRDARRCGCAFLDTVIKPRGQAMRRQLRLVWNVLRGRPVAYRIEVRDGVLWVPSGGMVVECAFLGRSGLREAQSQDMTRDPATTDMGAVIADDHWHERHSNQASTACACIGPPADDGDLRCVCARLAAEEGHPWERWKNYVAPRKQDTPT